MKNITHVEYGIYLVAVGTEMRKRNLCLTDIIEPATEEMKARVLSTMATQGMSTARIPEVFERSWVAMRSINLKTYQSRKAAAQTDETDKLPEGEW